MDRDVRVIVCGGRAYEDWRTFVAYMDNADTRFGISCIVQGGAPGADRLARRWAALNGIRCVTFDADWMTHGRAAGPIRNQDMIDKGGASMLIAFPGGRGTADMVARARKVMPVYEVRP